MRITIISGGQTGVDRAALDVALELGLPCGGWCPKGRKAEDGCIPECYPLRETPTAEYPERTEWNVRDADATLVLTWGQPSGGTALTIELAQRSQKLHRLVDLIDPWDAADVRAWLETNRVGVLNVAGPRAEGEPDMYHQAVRFLREVLG